MARLEIPLAQGWYKGLTIHFEDAQSSSEIHLEDNFLFPEQVHGSAIHVCLSSDLSKKTALAKADGIVADAIFLKSNKQKLLIQTADCLPLVFIERDKKKVALIHAGWKGLQQNIHLKLFEMHGFVPKNTLVWIGPSLNGKHYEVGPDVWMKFEKYKDDSKIFEATALNSDKRYFYVWRYLEKVFGEMGVPLVYRTEVDTFEDRSFASYRRSQKSGGREDSKLRNYTWLSF